MNRSIAYDFPQAAYLIFFVFIFILFLWYLYHWRKKTLSSFASPSVQKSFLTERLPGFYLSKSLALCFVWIFSVLALMQPKGNERYPDNSSFSEDKKGKQEVLLKKKAQEVVFLLDVSGSMSVKDSRNHLSRIDYAKEIADQILSRLDGQTASLYVFSGDIIKVVPATMDYFFLRLMLRQIQINEGGFEGSDFQKAFKTLGQLFSEEPASLQKNLILLSDGGDKEDIKPIELLGDPSKENLHIYTIGLGSKEGGEIQDITFEGKKVISKLDENFLEELSKKGDGQYYFANNQTAIDIAKNILVKLSAENPETDSVKQAHPVFKKDKDKNLVYDLFFQFPLGAAILFLGLYLFLPDTAYKKLKTKSKRIRIGSFLLLIMFFSTLSADEVEERMREGSNYFEAKEYPKAIQTFEKLKQLKLPPYPTAIILYDLGTSLLANGDLDNALETYNKISVQDSFSPLFFFRLKTNLAIAKIGKAEKILGTNEEPSNKAYKKALFLYNEALKNSKQALIYHCKLAKLEGRKSCLPPEELKKMQDFIEGKIVEVGKEYREFKTAHMTLKRSLPLLLVSLNTTLTNVNFIKEHPLEGALRKKYLEAFVSQGDMWLPLWNAVRIQSEKDYGKKLIDEPTLKKFIEAQKFFAYILRYLEKDNIENSLLGAQDAIKDIYAVAKAVLKREDLNILVESLLDSYEDAMAQTPLNEGLLQRLVIEQQQTENLISDLLKDKMSEQEYRLLTSKLSNTKINLLKGIDKLSRSKIEEAYFFLQEAMQELKRILYSIKEGSEDPKALLKNGIEEQQHAYYLEMLALKLEDKEKGEERKNLILNSQMMVTKWVESFLKEAYAKQKKDFQAKSESGKMDTRCQNSPWNAVIPLFLKGRELALQLEKKLKDKDVVYQNIQLAQEEVIKNWESALAKLDQPKTFSNGCFGQMSETAESEENKAPQDSNQGDFENVLRLLQIMESQDAKPQKIQTVKQEGVKPW